MRKVLVGRRIGTVTVIDGRLPGTYEGRGDWLLRCDCGKEFRELDKVVMHAGGACPKCSPYKPKRRNQDFIAGSEVLEQATMPELARMALKGSDSSLMEIVRRAWRS
jgi:hypothetical protein